MLKENVKNWIVKGLHDLKSAEILLREPEEEVMTDSICFHCQQAVEKFLKAFLNSEKIPFPRSHDLEYLLEICIQHDKDFSTIEVGNLTDYAVNVRYPDDYYLPDLDETQEAYQLAQIVKNFIFDKLHIENQDTDLYR